MEVFLARQPIFDKEKQVIAYEILYRDGAKNIYNPLSDGDIATTTVVTDTLVNFGIGGLTKGKKAFINFTKNLLLEDLPLLMDTETLIIEVLENVEIDARIVDKIKMLKEKGYTIALDDFEDHERFLPIIDYIDIIKVDFMMTTDAERKRVSNKYKPLGIQLLAEKVETHQEFEDALSYGYDLFQGFFFERPVVCKTKGLNVSVVNYMEIIRETMSEEPDFYMLTEIIKGDLSLTYKLLKLINSPAFYRRSRIESVQQALTMLGLDEIRKWITLIMLRDVSSEKPDELIAVSLSRALFSESIARYFNLADREDEAFLMGLFSLIDTIMEKPLFEILDDLPLNDDIKGALLGMKNSFYNILKLTQFYEKGNWDLVVEMSETYGFNCPDINSLYIEAVIKSGKIAREK